MTQFVELVKALAWPLVILITVLSFRAQISELIKRSSGFNFEALGLKFGMTVKEVHDVAQELFREVSQGFSSLTDKQRELFEAVRTSDGSKTVDEITLKVFGKSFVRKSEEHEQFRVLRDSKLIRPVGGGRWQTDSLPVVTSYAQIIVRGAPTILAAAKAVEASK